MRSEQIKSLMSGEEYDVLIIGGGATGAGCALDSVTRGRHALGILTRLKLVTNGIFFSVG